MTCEVELGRGINSSKRHQLMHLAFRAQDFQAIASSADPARVMSLAVTTRQLLLDNATDFVFLCMLYMHQANRKRLRTCG
jgi:hypothetical protein